MSVAKRPFMETKNYLQCDQEFSFVTHRPIDVEVLYITRRKYGWAINTKQQNCLIECHHFDTPLVVLSDENFNYPNCVKRYFWTSPLEQKPRCVTTVHLEEASWKGTILRVCVHSAAFSFFRASHWIFETGHEKIKLVRQNWQSEK